MKKKLGGEKKKKMKNKIELLSVLAVFALFAVIAVPSVSATYPANSVYFEPEDSHAQFCENTYVKIMVNANVDTTGAGMDIYFDPNCVNITNVDFTGTPYSMLAWWEHWGNYVRIGVMGPMAPIEPGTHLIANLTLHCEKEAAECTSDLAFTETELMDEDGDSLPDVTWHDGMFTCEIPEKPDLVDIRADGIASNIFDATDYMICPGTVTEDGVTIDNETAMGALVIYCQNNGINIHITMGTWGEYVVQIGNNPADNNSWSYAVNEEVPPVGGAQKVIVDGDRVHWYNYNLNYYSVLTSIDKTEIVVGETLTATVSWKDITGTHLLNGASVHVGAMGPWGPEPGPSVGTTGVDGTCTFSWSTVGTWGVYAVDPVHGSGIYNYPPVSFTCSTGEKPDLSVTEITSNCGGYLFASESNKIGAKIENIGGGGAGAFNVGFDIDGFSTEVRIAGLAAGENTTVCINDTTSRTAGDSVTITVTADCDGEVSESDETNNVLALAKTVANNGYKGKRYTGGDDINTWKTFELNGNLIYSLGDSYYLSSYSYPDWTEYNAGWTTGDLPIPGILTATIETARLFVPYTWDKAGVMPDSVGMSFNGNLQTLDAHYSDEKGWGTSYPYGMLVYDVTADFNTSGNAANLTNSCPDGGGVSMRGMLLVVVYADASEPERTILMNEEFDLLYGGASKCTTPDEATAYAPFGTIDTAGVKKATLITVAPGAGPNEGDLSFNEHMWYDVWNFVGTGSPTPQIGIAVTDVNTYLQAADNIAKFQSSADYMEASNAFLILEKEEEPMPDLEITDIWNNDGTIWFRIENRGTEEAGSSYTALYVNGAYQARKKVGSLDSRESTDLYFRYVYTPGTDDIVKVCADSGNDVEESNEGNNCKELIPDGKPDLVIEDKWEEWVNETHYTVTYTIHNKGTAIAPACHNTTLYVDGVAIEHKHVPVALAYCETYTDTFDTTIACTGYSDIIRVCADNYEVIDELDETNNCLVNVWSCEEGKPDLVIEDKWEEWVNETHYSVTYTIHNKGTAIAPACHNTTLYVDGVAIEHKHVPVALAYCETYTDTFDTTIECTGDSDIILVCADNYEVIDELDETNNCMTNEFTCVGPLPGPDLVITDIRENDGTIWFKIENRGTEEAGSSYTALYVNGAYQARKKVGSLDSGETTELYFRDYEWTCTACTGESDEIEVCADSGNDVAESNEKNNCRTVIWECDRRS